MFQLNEYEILIFALYNVFFITFIYFYKNYFSIEIGKYLIPGYLFKVLGGLILALVYPYYYGAGGDTYFYYGIASDLTEIFYQKPGLYIQSFFLSLDEFKLEALRQGYDIEAIRDPETFFFGKFQSIFCIFSFNSYLGLTLLNCVFSFVAAFSLFKLFNTIVKEKTKIIFNFLFLLPSVLIWGGGLLKDTITMVCFNLLIVLLYNIIYKKKIKAVNLLYFIFLSYIILQLKAYIFISFLIWILFVLFFFIIKKSKNPVLKFLMIPYLVIVLLAGISLTSTSLLNQSEEYKIDDIYSRIQGFHDYHKFLKGSAYDLGPMDYSVIGFLSKFPKAVNVTIFRPYPWEANSALFFLNSLESFVVLLYCIFVMIKIRTINIFKNIGKHSFLIGAISFCLFYSFVIGVTTYNFGALSRFKIPMVPIFLFCLLYAKSITQNSELAEQNV